MEPKEDGLILECVQGSVVVFVFGGGFCAFVFRLFLLKLITL